MYHLQTFKIYTQPTQEPFTPDDLVGQLNQDADDDGGKTGRVLTAAREKVELDTGVSLMPTVWRCFLDEFPYGCDNEIRLMRGPVTAVGSVTYLDGDGDSQTLSSSLYQTDLNRTPARIKPAFGQTWPTTRTSSFNAVTVQFTAGFTSTSAVPKKAIQAALMLAASWIDDPSMTGQIGDGIQSAYWSLVSAVHWEVFDE